MDRTESRGRACVDMDTSRGSTEKVLDELRACISGCAEDSIGRGGRAVFRSLCGRLFTEEPHEGIKEEKRSFWLGEPQDSSPRPTVHY
jgi:hypothetical protein